MNCQYCKGEVKEGASCPICDRSRQPFGGRASSPTLIKGLPGASYPASRVQPERRFAVLGSLLWTIAVLVAVPWMLAEHPSASGTYGPDGPQVSDVGTSYAANYTQDGYGDPDHVSMTIPLSPGHWVDTGIDMCSCAHISIAVLGRWEAPTGQIVNANGKGEPDRSPDHRLVYIDHKDALMTSAPYGALLGKVGTDPYVLIGSARDVDGSQFNDSGTLKIGMNAGRLLDTAAGDGQITVVITGTGATDHPWTYCPTPGS